MANDQTAIVEEAREYLGLLREFPEMPDINGRLTTRGSHQLDRIADAFERLLTAIGESDHAE
jgi:hypothetical protein